MTTTPKIYIVQGEHFSNPGRTMSAWSTRAAAATEAASLVNILLQDAELEITATAEDFEQKLQVARTARALDQGFVDVPEEYHPFSREEAIDRFLRGEDADVWITEQDLGGPFVLPEFIRDRLVNASAVIGLMSEQISQMKGMFDDEDGQIEDAMDEGDEEQNAIASVLAVSTLGGQLEGLTAYRKGLESIIALAPDKEPEAEDYDSTETAESIGGDIGRWEMAEIARKALSWGA